MADYLAGLSLATHSIEIVGYRTESSSGKTYPFSVHVDIPSALCGFFSVATTTNSHDPLAQVMLIFPNNITPAPSMTIIYNDESEEGRHSSETITPTNFRPIDRWGGNNGVRPSGDVATNISSRFDNAQSEYNSNYYNPSGYKVWTYDLMNALPSIQGGTINDVFEASAGVGNWKTDATSEYFFNQRHGMSGFRKVDWKQTTPTTVITNKSELNGVYIDPSYLFANQSYVSGAEYDLFITLTTGGKDEPVKPPSNTNVTVWIDSSKPANLKITWDNDSDDPPEKLSIKYTAFTLGVATHNKTVEYNFADGFVQYTWGALELLLDDRTDRLDLDITVGVDTGHVNITGQGTDYVPANPTTVGHLTYQCKRGSGENDEGYSNKIDDSDATDDNTTTQTVSLLTQTYKLADVNLKALGNFLWSADLLDNLKLVNNNPIENLVSVKALPVDVTNGSGSYVTLGNVNTQVSALKCNVNFVKTEIGSVSIPRIYNNFVDFEHAKIELYLPLIGTITDLNPAEVMGYTITLKYCFDLVTGDTLAMVYNNRGGGQNCIGIYKGSSGIDIPLTASNRAQVEAGYISDFVSAVGSVATGNVGGAINAGLGALTRQYTSKSSGSVSGVTSQGLPNKAYITIIENVTQIPSHYAHTFGRPCCLGKKLSSLVGKGFTQCNENVDLSGLSCSDNEREELRGILSSGFYL